MPSAEVAAGGRQEPDERLTYPELQRRGRTGWGWSILGLLALVLGVFLGAQVVGVLLVVLADLAGARVDTDPVTPWGLAWVNLVWAIAIPLTFGVAYAAHREPPRWLASVAGRIRWRWLLVCAGLAVVALGVTVGLSVLLPEQGGADLAGPVNDFTTRTRAFLLVILLLTPLQAAGEEYVFRGYLTQAFGGVVRAPAWLATGVAVVVPALLFALAHGPQDPPVFVDRLAFGLVAGIAVIVTGGLEAGIAMHVLNNWVAFGLALALGDMDAALTPAGGTWWTLPGTLVQSLVFLGLVTWAARRLGVARRTGAELEGSRAPV